MKSTLKQGKCSEKKYPKLMQSDNGLMVLFTESSEGFVLYDGGSDYCIGYHSSTWHDDGFKDFDGTVELNND